MLAHSRIALQILVIGLLFSFPKASMASGAEVAVLGDPAPWRIFLVAAPAVEGTANEHRPRRNDARKPTSPLPSPDWMAAEFDDGVWARYRGELPHLLGDYGHSQSIWTALLCMRTRFGVSDPAKVEGLKFSLTYRGGGVVYVNGVEVARGHMPPGEVEPLTLAQDYPVEAFMMPDGKKPLRRTSRPAKQNLERYEMRIRKLETTIPPKVLRKGANVLAVEIHRTAMRRTDWNSVGFYEATLTAESDAGLIPYDDALDRLTIWNASPLATVSAAVGEKLRFRSSWDAGAFALSVMGLQQANPFDPLRPIRMPAPRNGVGSGQVVVSDPGGLRGVAAEMGPMRHPDGHTIPAKAIQIRYAVQQEGAKYCDALMTEPAGGAPVQPVWFIVDVPKKQEAGWYTGTLAVRANGAAFRVPVQLLVSGWTLPDPKEYLSFASLLQSPDSVALKYGVEPFSDRHFQLLEPSIEMMGQVGNDVVFIPVIHGTHMGHQTGMIRWVKQGDVWSIDFAAMERYLDLYEKHCGPPKVLCVIVWKPTLGNRAQFRGVKQPDPKPAVVTRLDPATGKMSELEAPIFGGEGSEAFWRPALDGIREIVRRRGWDERRIMLGQGFDSRPLEDVQAFFNRIVPNARWVVYSHWQGDPGPKDGGLVVSGGMEVGYREEVHGGALPILFPDRPELAQRKYLSAGSHRIQVLTWSSPAAYRNLPNITGTFCRLGLDFWPVVQETRGLRSLFSTKICGPWLYKAHPREIVAPGPDGAVPTVRFQMLREGVQETEARIAVVKALAALDEEKRERYENLLEERVTARRVAECLTQAQISLDWPGLTSRMFDAAAELADQPSAGRWDSPPDVTPN